MTSLKLELEKYEAESQYKERKLIQTLNDLSDIQSNITELLLEQDNKLDSIENNISSTELRVKKALDDLSECDKMYFSYKPIVVGTILGGAVCSPLVTLVGLKYLGISTGVGSVLGGLVGYKIQK